MRWVVGIIVALFMCSGGYAKPFNYSAELGGIKLGMSKTDFAKTINTLGFKCEELLNDVGGKYTRCEGDTVLMGEKCYEVKGLFKKNKLSGIMIYWPMANFDDIFAHYDRTADKKYALDDGEYAYVFDNCHVLINDNESRFVICDKNISK